MTEIELRMIELELKVEYARALHRSLFNSLLKSLHIVLNCALKNHH